MDKVRWYQEQTGYLGGRDFVHRVIQKLWCPCGGAGSVESGWAQLVPGARSLKIQRGLEEIGLTADASPAGWPN